MLVSILCNWVLGMPAAYVLAFPLGYGVVGLWTGRAIASITSGLLMTGVLAPPHANRRAQCFYPSDLSARPLASAPKRTADLIAPSFPEATPP